MSVDSCASYGIVTVVITHTHTHTSLSANCRFQKVLIWGHILETSYKNLRKTSYLRKIIGKYRAKH